LCTWREKRFTPTRHPGNMPPALRRRTLVFLVVTAVLGAAAAYALAQSGGTTVGVIGPANRIQPSGRLLNPVGKLTQLGNHPGGGALSPNGAFLWAVDAGRGKNDVKIVQVAATKKCKAGKRGAKCRAAGKKRVGKVIQTIPMPGASGGIAFSPDGKTAFVSGLKESAHKDEQSPAGTPGKDGDTIHVFAYNGKTGKAKRTGLIPVPPPSDAPTIQNFPPKTTKLSWPRDLAVSPDGKTLLAALNLADHAAVIDVKTKAVTYVPTGSYPYGAAITRDGKNGLVSNEADGTLSVIDLASKKKVKDIQVGPNLSHPEGVATNPKGPFAYVAIAHSDQVAVVNTNTLAVERTLSVERPEGIGTEPTQVSVSSDGCRLTAADSGEDAVAVFALRSDCKRLAGLKSRRSKFAGPKRYALLGKVPVASYPVMAAPTPKSGGLVWIAAKGLGVGPNPHGPNPLSANDSDDNINTFRYLPSIVTGISGIATPFPTDKALKTLTPIATKQITPTNAEQPPAGTPLDAPGKGKIDHVFYIVRENRTYDQIFGDEKQGDSDPNLTLFGNDITPNAHALANRFGLLDHVYANSEASIDGHFWTSAGAVSDYVVKNWHQNYAGRDRPYDFGVYAVTWPAKRFLFDQAQKSGISWFNYGEAVAGVVPLTDRNRTAQDNADVTAKFAKSDLGVAPGCYANDASIGSDAITGVDTFDASKPVGAPLTATSRFDCFRQRFLQQTTTNSVPAFNYLSLPSDHTEGTSPGRRTPQAMMADNDYALGQIVDLISHSNVWDSSLILVVEDDSQDGADHVDAHRIPALAISPFSKRGAVVHTRYDFLSFIRTLEIPIGMPPLSLFDTHGVPLYDVFSNDAGNAEPYTAIPPNIDINARNPASAPNAKLSRSLNLNHTDEVPQRVLDKILWQAVHGAKSQPPPPGPNAEAEDGDKEDEGGVDAEDLRDLANQQSGGESGDPPQRP
jgi:YVTN family beta-propeller protein